MSYIFHVWEHPKAAPIPRTPEQAANFIRVASGIQPGLNPKYVAFAQALTAQYPDLDSMEDTGDDSDQGVWTDSPIDGRTENAIYTIGVHGSCLDHELLWFIVHAAFDQGLHVFDMQAGTLFFPDRTCTGTDGRLSVANLLRPHRPEPDWEEPAGCVAKSIGGKSIKEAAEQVVEVVARFHAPADFMPFVPEPVKNLAKERTKTLPACAEDVPIIFSTSFDSQGMSAEEFAAKRKSLQLARKEPIFRAMTAVHQYFYGK
ncbi:MAG: hypothetical protein HGA71_14645 [Azonexaceae bacterium]|nr:hypothetical protein [Azonexaceae bacterium]